MRLLHTSKLTFKEFFDNRIPKYCILSHRWGNDEVSYHDFLAGLKGGSGYRKIRAACQLASGRETRAFLDSRAEFDDENPECYMSDSESLGVYEWIWIDTCCIDKSSSAELSEAINSMYHWYERSEICFAYLKDVKPSTKWVDTMNMFSDSEWHQRGWTLQELLAPQKVYFLNESWKFIGTKTSLSATISSITGISERHLSGELSGFESRSESTTVAEKMSWAARRRTSRREDQAYCLLGLFAINMPLLYGEGDRAFERLQHEIIRSSDDESVFLGNLPRHKFLLDETRKFFGMGLLPTLAQCSIRSLKFPTNFSRAQTTDPRNACAVTNKGLEIHVPSALAARGAFILPLNCVHPKGGVYAIALRLFGATWFRTRAGPVGEYDRALGDGVFIVARSRLWNRATLLASGSEVIYIQLAGFTAEERSSADQMKDEMRKQQTSRMKSKIGKRRRKATKKVPQRLGLRRTVERLDR